MSPIVTAPHPVLRQVAKPVTTIDKKLLAVIKDMTKALLEAKNPEGVGLAAPQIGVPLRLFLIRPDPKKPPRLFINPEIIKFSQALQTPKKKSGVYEGCLSLPGHYAPITRAMSVTLKYQTLKPNLKSQIPNPKQTPNSNLKIENLDIFWKLEIGNWKLEEKTEVFSGFPAHIIQHEMDHLNGILFIDRVLEQNTKLYQVTGSAWHEIPL